MGLWLAEALQNMKLSAHGSIRKKTIIIQTVVVVKNLGSDDASSSKKIYLKYQFPAKFKK